MLEGVLLIFAPVFPGVVSNPPGVTARLRAPTGGFVSTPLPGTAPEALGTVPELGLTSGTPPTFEVGTMERSAPMPPLCAAAGPGPHPHIAAKMTAMDAGCLAYQRPI